MADKIDLDALEALEKEASDGPWKPAVSGDTYEVADVHGEPVAVIAPWSRQVDRDDASLIAALRNAAPYLLAALRAADELAEAANCADVVMDTAAASGVRDVLAPAYAEGWARAHLDLQAKLREYRAARGTK